MPHDFDNLQDVLRVRSAEMGSEPAYALLGHDLEISDVLSYLELEQASNAIARQLETICKRGDRVLLAFNNGLEAVQLFWGCILARLIPIPAPVPDARIARVSEARLRSISGDANVSLAFTHEDHINAGRAQIPGMVWLTLKELQGNPTPDHAALARPDFDSRTEIAYLQYTSGSTSSPRGVEITHSNVLAQSAALMSDSDTEHKRALIWLPWFHDYGLIHGVIQPVCSGGTAFLMSTAHFLLRPLTWLEAIGKHRITHSGAPNFAYLACVQALARKPGWTAQLKTWQLASCGAEPVRATTLEAFATSFAPFGFDQSALAPSYGLAEAVLAVTVRATKGPLLKASIDANAMEKNDIRLTHPKSTGSKTLVGCGRPLPGFHLRIVDPETSELCESSRIGEIWLSGPSVGKGYWGKAEATVAQFGARLANQPADSSRYLRTGDLGFMYEGELFVAGRLKDLILINGRNLYPQDLELTAEASHPIIRTGGVIAIPVDKSASEAVVLLIECNRMPSPDAVRELIETVQKQVGLEHQIELYDVVPLRAGTLQRTSSGKLRRNEARRLYMQGALEPLRLAATATPDLATSATRELDAGLLDIVTKVWADVLGQEEIGLEANFFDLGGDSLLATQLVSRLRIRTGIELPISALFESPTVLGLAKLMAQIRPDKPVAPDIEKSLEIDTPKCPREVGDPVDMSYSQERMWFMQELAPTSSAYNVPLAIRFHGPLNVEAMREALSCVVERHEILRTRYIKTPDGVRGEVVSPAPAHIEEIQLADATESDSHEALLRQLTETSCAPFQLNEYPLFRTQVVHIAEHQAVLLFVMHHIICDQWSFAELGRELAGHYSALLEGKELALPRLPIQYADYAQWHRKWFEGERRSSEIAYWTRRLNGLEPLALNHDFLPPKTPSFKGASLRRPLNADLIDALQRLGAQHGSSLSMVLLAALYVLLYRHTSKKDIAIGVPIANRHHLPSENLLGSFVNTLVFRTSLEGDPDFLSLLTRVRETSLEAFAHQDMPLEVLVRELAAGPNGTRQPLFNVMFNMVNSRVRDCHFEGLEWSRLDFDRGSAQFDLTFVADLIYDRALAIEYSTELFSPETVAHMGEHLENILSAAVRMPNTPIAAIPMLGLAERAILTDWSCGPEKSMKDQSLVQWLAGGTRISPHGVAVASDTGELTHMQLDESSNRLARLLRQRGVSRGSRVGVCLPRNSDLDVTLLAILKTGAAYVPLDPAYPSERLKYQIDDADLLLLVTLRSMSQACQYPPRLLLDDEEPVIASMAADPLKPDSELDARPEDPAYVIYTSGSTGKPKGVAIAHRAVVNFMTSMAHTPGLTAQDRVLAVTTPSFDIAVLELFLPLGVGGTVVIASEAQSADGRLLAEVIRSERITVLQATPSRWHLLLAAGWAGDHNLKALVGGEPLSAEMASQLLTRCCEVWNMYGPTESTVWSSCWRVSADELPSIDLGRPVLNTTIQILDEHLQPCAIGVPGEICIGGEGLALGYYKNDALTAERFVESPGTDGHTCTRLYRTGDRGRWRYNGSLEHGGRLDDQIKLRGFRVELGEIESNLASHASVRQAVATLREDLAGQARLVAYVVPNGPMPSREALRGHLRRWLPDYMVPNFYVEVNSIPLLPNGKTDRKALPMPGDDFSDPRGPCVGPRNAIEKSIAGIWKDALEIEHLGVQDNFFDLGGHSILAVTVVSRIELALKQTCPLTLLFAHPTVAELAAALVKAQADDAPDLPVAILQPLGNEPGLFLLAGAGMYRHVADQLGHAMPVYGVFSQTEIDILQKPDEVIASAVSVETLAQEYLTLIREVQPHGPYFLGGFSIGGALAFEVAKHLRLAGEEISLIILLDSLLPGRTFRHLLSGVHRRLRLLRRQGFDHLLHVYRVHQHQTVHRHEPGARRNQIYARIMRAHKPSPCDLPALFLQADEDAAPTPAYGWRSLIPSLIVERVPGKHMEIMEPPNAKVLGSRIQIYMDRVKGLSVPTQESKPERGDSSVSRTRS